MNNARFVRSFERECHLTGNVRCFCQRQGAPGDALRERLPFNEFEYESLRRMVVFEPEYLRDVGMIQGREDPRLPLEPGQTVCIVGEFRRQNLEGDVPAKPAVSGAIHLPHPARPDGANDLVHAEACTDAKGHWAGL